MLLQCIRTGIRPLLGRELFAGICPEITIMQIQQIAVTQLFTGRSQCHLGARFYDEGKEGDALEILKKYGANSLRIRLWNDPYSEDIRLLSSILYRPIATVHWEDMPAFNISFAYTKSIQGEGYLIAKGFFDTIPNSLREAAYLDGASEATIFWKVVIPMSRPIIVYTVISSFLSPWMDFVYAKLMLNAGISSQWTVAIGLYIMTNNTEMGMDTSTPPAQN